MRIRLTIEFIDDDATLPPEPPVEGVEKYGVLVVEPDLIPAKEFGAAVEHTIDRWRGHNSPCPAPQPVA